MDTAPCRGTLGPCLETPATDPAPDLLHELNALLGAESVRSAASDLDRIARTTLPSGTRPVVIVRPRSCEQVQCVVRVARRCAVSVHPISAGKNWGYGDACAPADGAVIVDLSAMNRILEVNAELAYAVIEPGVTQGQLADHLAAQRIPLWMDCTGAGPDASILGNMMERGFGHSRYGDRFAHTCAMEFVLADGSVVRTGSASAAGGRGEHVFKYGLGPAIDGLFSQANLGILTRATVWLMPQPERFCAFFLTMSDRRAIGPLAETLRRLRLSGTVRSTVHIFNDMRMLGAAMRYPWDAADGTAALEVAQPDLCARSLRAHGVAAWSASGCLSGTRAEVAAARSAVRRAVRAIPGLEQAFFIGPARMRAAHWLHRALARGKLMPAFQSKLAKLRLGYDLLRGRPSYDTLGGAHWRARGRAGATQDPLDSGSGMLWVSPILPMTADAVLEVERRAQAILHRHGFEYQVTYSTVSDRALCGVISICYDHTDARQTARALQCHDALVDELVAAGFLPYRASAPTIARCRAAAPAFWNLAARLKQALDPDGVIAPGRYIPDGRGGGPAR